MEVDPREIVAIKIGHDFNALPADVVEMACLDALIHDAPLNNEYGQRIGKMVGFKVEPDGVLVEYQVDNLEAYHRILSSVRPANVSFGFDPPDGIVGSSPCVFSLIPR